jgi:hypothetical protein
MSTRTAFGFGAIGGFLLLAVALAALPPGASAQKRPASAPATHASAPASQLPPAATPPAMQAPSAGPLPSAGQQTADMTPAVPAGAGLCQCVAQTNRLDFSCPGSVQACQSACGTQYSFKPDAQCRSAGNP